MRFAEVRVTQPNENPETSPAVVADATHLAPEETSGHVALPPDATAVPSVAPATKPATAASAPEKFYKQSFIRWFGLGTVRLIYRAWTRIASRYFPEGSPQERAMERLGIPTPDRLDLSWITPDLAVGGRIRVGDIPKLQRAGVTRVVDVRAEHKDDEAALNANEIQLLYLPTPDTYPLSLEDLRRGAQWINEQRAQHQRVLIHCEHGVGRSVLLTAAALVCEGYSAHDAFDLIGNKRWQASPNHRQVLRLTDFERAGACGGK
jgi:protein tyrosine phosphatase (PTP) superfamily phosphohydrolase (DUF442 family)